MRSQDPRQRVDQWSLSQSIMRSDTKKAPILDDDNGARWSCRIYIPFLRPALKLGVRCPQQGTCPFYVGLLLMFYAGKHSATKKAESALEELQALYRTQDSEDSEVKRDDPKETSKPLSMLDLFKANPQP
ncbi:MAG: hypothetical protein WCG15_05850 [Actinomycetes bacterium]